MIRTLAGSVILLCLLVSTAPPAEADCGLPRLLRSNSPMGYSYLQTPGVVPEIGIRSSVTTDMRGSFWALGAGDPTPHPAGDDLGIDNGSWPALEGDYFGYYYYGWVIVAISPYAYYAYSATISGSWAQDSRIDGCPDQIPGAACIAVLLADQDEGKGYFGLITKQENVNSNVELARPGDEPYNLVELPKLAINGSDTFDGDHTDFELEVAGPTLASIMNGLYLDPNCDNSQVISGYKIYSIQQTDELPVPVDRDRTLWTDITPAPGLIPLGEAVTVPYTCDVGGFNVFLTTSLVFDSGFELPVVSKNSSRVACGTTLADPADLQRKPGRKPGRKTKR